jgi:hypothetical protein
VRAPIVFLTVLGALGALACDVGSDAPDPVAKKPDGGGLPAGAPTWADIAPVIESHCVGSCHVENGSAPFALTTYAEGSARHAYIAAAVAESKMPPWLPGDGCGTFLEPRRLTAAQTNMLVAWSQSGAREGVTLAPLRGHQQRSRLARLDASLDIGVDYVPVPSAGAADRGDEDDFHCFLLDEEKSKPLLEQFVVGWEVVPTVKSQVLEVRLIEIAAPEAALADAADPSAGWACQPSAIIAQNPNPNPVRLLGTWASGSGAVVFPIGAGVKVRAGNRLALQIHYHRHGKHDRSRPFEPDRTRLDLQVSSTVAREVDVVELTLPSADIRVPPLAFGHAASGTIKIEGRGDLLAVQPRLGKLGQSLHAELHNNTCLIDVPRWDYHWEETYFFRNPIAVPDMATLHLRCVWDNPTDQVAIGGSRFQDEICGAQLFIAR